MRPLAATILAALVTSINASKSPGCGHATPPNLTPGHASTGLTIDVPAAGGTRNYLLNLPQTYDVTKSQPLILAFHGKAQDAAQFEAQTQLTDPEFNAMGAVVAFPEGINKQWLGDPESPPKKDLDDIAFAQKLYEHLVEDYCVDLSRVYIVGFSNGGGLTNLLACDLKFSSHVAAATIVSGAVYKDKSLKGNEPLFDVCNPARSPLPIFELHGSKDPVIHYDGKSTPDGETYPIDEWVAGWRERNGCGGKTREEAISIHKGTVAKKSWYCEDEEVVTHYCIEGFGHGWPSKQRQEDDGQRYGPLEWNGTRDILHFLGSKVLPARSQSGSPRDEL
ncbi:polyhydroxybutyrate depolymerase, partial [Lecanoromycetidae sp. Uapishka_2]